MRNDRCLAPEVRRRLEKKVNKMSWRLTEWARRQGILEPEGSIYLAVHIMGERKFLGGFAFPESLLEISPEGFFTRERFLAAGATPSLATRTLKGIRGEGVRTMREFLQYHESKTSLTNRQRFGLQTADLIITTIRKACTPTKM